MKTNTALFVIAAVLAAGSALGVSKYEHDSDFTLLVNVVSDPPGAEVYSVPASTNEEASLLGRTPYTALIEFDWRSGWFSKRWGKLAVHSPAEICRAEYTSKTKHYDIYMTYQVEAPGREPVQRDDLIAAFNKPRDLDWEHINFLPPRKTIEVALAQDAASVAAAAETEKAGPGPSTVMMATESDEAAQLGTVHVVANIEDAAVMVDGKPAGRAPVKLVLGPGDHSVEVHKQGYLSYSNSISVKPRSQVALKVTLAPAGERSSAE